MYTWIFLFLKEGLLGESQEEEDHVCDESNCKTLKATG